MRPRPATRAASYVNSCSAFSSPLGGGMTASARQRSAKGVPHLPKPVPGRDLAITLATAAVANGPACSYEQAGGGGRNARATSMRSRASSGMSPGDSPSWITGLPLALPQSFGEFRNAHVSLNPLSAKLLRAAIQKLSCLVKKLWRMRLPCGGMRKTKNKFWRETCVLSSFNDLDRV